jgi:hypothetical protein
MTIRGFAWRMATRRWDIDVKFNVLKTWPAQHYAVTAARPGAFQT